MAEQDEWLSLYGTDNVWVELAGGIKQEKPKCSCGTSILLGKDDQPEFHSDYCDLQKKEESK